MDLLTKAHQLQNLEDYVEGRARIIVASNAKKEEAPKAQPQNKPQLFENPSWAVHREGIFTGVLSYFLGAVPLRNLNLSTDKALFVLHHTESNHLDFIICKNAAPQAPPQLTGDGPGTGTWTWELPLGLWGGPALGFSKTRGPLKTAGPT